jgi:hypothetical protein
MASGGLLVLGGCGVALTVLFIAGDRQETSVIAGIMGVVLGLPSLAIALRSWARQATEATAAQVGQARDSLAGWVCDQWRDEALSRSLGHPQPMPVQWRLTEHPVMDRLGRIVDGAPSFTGNSADISVLTTQFRGLLRRRLVILGGPGSGKTTLAVQLLLELLATRQPGEPIPVLVSLAGWDPTTHPQLHGWLSARLAENYPSLLAFGSDVARALVEQGHILPILDGFDEVPAARQPEMLIALNTSLTEADQLVLTSRTREYQSTVAEAHKVLTAAAIIEPEPLTPDQAAEYLQACLPPDPDSTWCEILDRLRAGTAPHLAAVLATPLGLWLLRTVYLAGGADPRTTADLRACPRHRQAAGPLIRPTHSSCAHRLSCIPQPPRVFPTPPYLGSRQGQLLADLPRQISQPNRDAGLVVVAVNPSYLNSPHIRADRRTSRRDDSRGRDWASDQSDGPTR